MMVVVGRWVTRLMDAMEGAAGEARVGTSHRRRTAAFLLFVGLVAIGIGTAMRLGSLADLRGDTAVLERLEARCDRPPARPTPPTPRSRPRSTP